MNTANDIDMANRYTDVEYLVHPNSPSPDGVSIQAFDTYARKIIGCVGDKCWRCGQRVDVSTIGKDWYMDMATKGFWRLPVHIECRYYTDEEMAHLETIEVRKAEINRLLNDQLNGRA